MTLAIERIKIYVKPWAADMRKQINGLAIVAEEEMELDVFSGSMFIFCNRPRKILKALYWDRTGFGYVAEAIRKKSFPLACDRAEGAREASDGYFISA